MNISPEIINEIFYFSNNSAYEISCGNCLSRLNILHILRSSPLQVLLLKYVIKYLTKSKKQPQGCPYRLCKTFKGEVASKDLLIFIGNPNIFTFLVTFFWCKPWKSLRITKIVRNKEKNEFMALLTLLCYSVSYCCLLYTNNFFLSSICIIVSICNQISHCDMI